MAGNDSSSSSPGEARLIPLGSHADSPPIPIRRPATVVGARKDIVRLHLDSSTVSKAHCLIVLNDWGCYVHDLGSRTHTWVNGQQVIDADLSDGDTLQIGRFQFKYAAPSGARGKPRSAPEAELDVSTLTDALPLRKRVTLIGRRSGSDLEFDDDAVSNIHALIFERNGRRYIRDIGSRTGTWLDGKPIHQEELRDGALLKVGPATITFNEALDEVAESSSSVLPLPPLPIPPVLVEPIPLELDEPTPIERVEKDDSLPLELELDDEAPIPVVEEEPVEASETIEPAEPIASIALTESPIEAPLPLTPIDEPAETAPALELVEAEASALDVEAEIGNEAETEAAEDDALAALRRGWHGAARGDDVPIEDAPAETPVETSETSVESTIEPETPDAAPIEAVDEAIAAEATDASAEETEETEEAEATVEELAADALPPAIETPVPEPAVSETPAEPMVVELPPPAHEPTVLVVETSADVPESVEDDLAIPDEAVEPADEKSQQRGDALAELDLLDTELLEPIEAVSPETRELPALEPDSIDEAPAIDLSSARFDDDLLDDETDEPAPVSELEAIDFSHLQLDSPHAPGARSTHDHGIDELEPYEDNDDGSSAAPLMNLADSMDGAIDADDDIEIIEETRPTPSSALPESLDDDPEIIARRSAMALEDLPEGDAGETVEAIDEILDEAGPEQSEEPTVPPVKGDLSDLIPQHGPLLGGAFGPSSQEFIIGGSPIVELAPGEAEKEPEPVARRDAEPPHEERRKPLRVGFNGGAPASASASPFAGAERTIADLLIGRRAAQSVDVFANPSPTPEDLLLDKPARKPDTKKPEAAEPAGAGEAAPQPAHADEIIDDAPAVMPDEVIELQQAAERFRPRGTAPTLESFSPTQIPPTFKPEEDLVFVAQLRRGRLRRVLACTLLLLPLIGAVVFGVYRYVPVYSRIDAVITFNGLDRLSMDDLRQFKAIQSDLLQDDNTRKDALNLLDQRIAAGFLSDVTKINQALVRTPSERWPANQPGAMRLIVMSREKEDDRARLRALTQALIKSSANGDRAARAKALRQGADDDYANIKTREVQKAALEQEIQALRAMGESRPSEEILNKLDALRKSAEADLKAARLARMDVESSIDLLQKQAPAELAPSPEADLSKSDGELTKLNARLAELQKQNDLAKSASLAKSDTARKSLDTVINQFQAELESAQKLRDNPELVQYVEAAKRIFAQTRQLTDDLIRRQEQQHTRLSELKTRLSDRIEAHTREMLEKDGELKKMNDELAMLTRQQNAAVAEGLPEEGKKVALKIDLIRSLIRGREELFKKDPVHAETINALQGIIEQTEKSIQEDRKHIDATLTKSQEDFIKNGPAVEKLPAEQKQLAESIEKKLSAVAEARKAYSEAADAAEAEQARHEAELKDKMSALQVEIHGRRQVVLAAAREQQAVAAEEARKRRLSEKKTELLALADKEKSAQAALDAIVAEKEKMSEHRRRLIATEQDYNEKIAQRDELDRDIRTFRMQYDSKRMQLSQLVVPEEKFELESYDQSDRRPVYAGVGGGAIFALMLIPIVWNLRLLSRDSHSALPAGGFDPFPRTPSNGDDAGINGHAETADPLGSRS